MSLKSGVTGIAIVILVLVAGPFIPFKKVDISLCSISGSRKVVTRWFGLLVRMEVTRTTLESWIKQREPQFQPQWVHMSTNTRFLLGRTFACSSAPPIYSLEPLMNHLTGNLSEGQIAKLVNVMRTGTREDQRALLRQIADEIFESLENEPSVLK